MPESTELLAGLDRLRARTRRDRQGYAFPLFLFGCLILLAPLTYVTLYLPQEILEKGIYVDEGPVPLFVSTSGPLLKYPDLVGWYWVATIVGGLWLTSWWYRRRARLSGVETDLRTPIAAAAAAVLGFVLWRPLTSVFSIYPLYSLPAVNLPILFSATALAAGTYWWSMRQDDWPRTAGVFVATFFATVAFGSVGVYFISGFAGLMAIAVALLALAWWERSVLLGVVATVFLLVSIPANHPIHQWDIQTIYDYTANAQVHALYSVLAPGVVLLTGGLVAVLRARR